MTHFLNHTAGHCYFAKHKCVVPYQSKAKLFPFSFKNKQTSTHQNKQNKSKKDSRRPSWIGSMMVDKVRTQGNNLHLFRHHMCDCCWSHYFGSNFPEECKTSAEATTKLPITSDRGSKTTGGFVKMLTDVHAAALQLSDTILRSHLCPMGISYFCFLSWLSPKKTSSVFVWELSTDHSTMCKWAHHDPRSTMTTLSPE